MENKKHKCHWCTKEATRMDYRSIDGTISKIKSCEVCYAIDTKQLIEIKYGK
jgi:hypothetical protein